MLSCIYDWLDDQFSHRGRNTGPGSAWKHDEDDGRNVRLPDGSTPIGRPRVILELDRSIRASNDTNNNYFL
jgi:hypothetical protein